MGKSAENAVMSQEAPYSMGTTPMFSRCVFSAGLMRRLSCHSCTCWGNTAAGEAGQRQNKRFAVSARQELTPHAPPRVGRTTPVDIPGAPCPLLRARSPTCSSAMLRW